jgi:hypothetical protein
MVLGNSLDILVRGSVRGSVELSIENLLDDLVSDSLNDSVWQLLWNSVEDSVDNPIWASACISTRLSVNKILNGNRQFNKSITT